MKFVVLSSSRGTTFQAVIDALNNQTLNATCLGLVADREDRGCVAKAREANLPVVIVEKKEGESREQYDQRLHQAIMSLGSAGDDIVIAALGWMFILSPSFIHHWRHKIINVHPALLPKHPGAHAIRDTIKAGDSESGMTIHIIDEGVDTGPILLQKKIPVVKGETEESLKKKIQELEKEWYPKVLQMIEGGEMRLS